MPTIDHLVYAVPDLAAAVEHLAARTGVRAAAGGSHPGWGTHNAVVSLGPRTYLELVAPDPALPHPDRPRPFGLDAATGPRLAGWALAVADITATVARARSAGLDLGAPYEMSRRRPDGVTLRWRLTPPTGEDPVVPFLVEWATAEHPAGTTAASATLRTLTASHPDAEAVTAGLRALGADLDIHPGPVAELLAVVAGPAGSVRLAGRRQG